MSGAGSPVRYIDAITQRYAPRLPALPLGLPEPLYHHHRLITDATGRKLAKSARDTSLRSLRQAGMSVDDVRRRVGLALA